MDYLLKFVTLLQKFLDGKKTYLVCIGLAYQTVSPFIHGDITLAQLFSGDNFTHLLEASGLATLRMGVSKSAPK